jgi:hypothetical protein
MLGIKIHIKPGGRSKSNYTDTGIEISIVIEQNYPYDSHGYNSPDLLFPLALELRLPEASTFDEPFH